MLKAHALKEINRIPTRVGKRIISSVKKKQKEICLTTLKQSICSIEHAEYLRIPVNINR